MIGTTYWRLTRRLQDAFWCRVWNLLGRWQLRSIGVSLGHDVVLYGFPIVSLSSGSSIELQDRVVLGSVSRLTALGVSRPVVLRTLQPGARILVGRDCGLSGTTVCAATTVTIGDECLFGADVQLMDTDFHPIAAERRRFVNDQSAIASAPIAIGRNVFLGTGTKVLKGVTIGDNAVIGAGSVVTRDVPANALACGNPARVIGVVPEAKPHAAFKAAVAVVQGVSS